MEKTASGPGRIRQLNRTAVLAHIRMNGKNSRLQIGKELGLSAAAMTSVVNELLDEELLIKSKVDKNARSSKTQGRPITTLELNPHKAYAFGILLRPVADICIIESAWADYTGEVFTFANAIKVETDHFQSVIDGIAKAIAQLTLQIPANSKIGGVSIGVPGVVENQTIPIAPKLRCIENPSFISELKERIEFPISFENDVNLGAMSELKNQARLREISFAYLHIYSGVGSSIVLEGKLLKGRRGWAGEIGLLKTRSNDNQQVTYEQLLSVDNILADTLEQLEKSRQDLDALATSFEEKDPKVVTIITNYAKELFNAINTLHSVIDLDEVIIDFPSTALLNTFLPFIKQHIDNLQHSLKISVPSMEHQAHLHGAALNALNLALESIELRELITKK